jgi:NAD(P)-dependent dehydrogenase (short-subunit alcohol dehydrogenase family)
MPQPVCIVSGVGFGTGLAISQRFAEGGYQVAMLARNAERLAQFEADVPHTRAYVCDVADETAVQTSIAQIVEHLGPPSMFVHNAVGVEHIFGNFLEIDPAGLQHNFQVNTMGLLYLARAIAPHMLSQGHGSLIVTGNTSAWRGRAQFAAFAPTKAAQRILAQSMARTLGPQGVHVAYMIIDGGIDMPFARKLLHDKPDEFFMKPSAIADTIWHVAHQDRSCWSFEVDLRPFGEEW